MVVKNKKRLLFFGMILLFFFNKTWARDENQVCIACSEEMQVVAGVSRAHNSDIERAQKTLDSFNLIAKANAESGNVEEILKLFSKYDSSYLYAREELKNTSGKFTGYAGLKSGTIKEAFAWGNYLIAIVNYQHDRGEVSMLENFFCTKDSCQMSNSFEHPGQADDLMSRWIGEYLKGKNRVECPPNPTLKIWPESLEANVKPLEVYVNKELINKAYKRKKIGLILRPTDFSDCYKLIAPGVLVQSESEVNGDLIKSFLSRCTINMTERSLVPVIHLDGNKAEKGFMTPSTLLGYVRSAQKVTDLYRFKESAGEIFIVLFENSSEQKLLVALSVVSENHAMKLDWRFYGTALGELLASRYFYELTIR